MRRHSALPRKAGIGAFGICLVALLLGACSGGNDAPVKVTTLVDDPKLPEQYRLEPAKYLLGPGDVLRILFLADKDFNSNIIVTPDGFISVPLLDDPIHAAGLNMAELKQEIEKQLGSLVRNPKIFLNLVELGSQHVFVLGHVTVPHVATSDPLTLAGVISACGGIKKDGQRKQVIVVRRNPGDDPIVFDVNFAELLNGNSLMPDIPLQRYDIVIVPKSNVAKVRDFVQAAVGNTLSAPADVLVDFVILRDAFKGAELDPSVN